MNNKVAILDAGAQYGKVIDRRIRELGVESDLIALDSHTDLLKNYDALIISGGPESVFGANAPKYNPDIFTLGIPVLGICYGLQLMNYTHGGTVVTKNTREDGQFEITVDTKSPLFDGLEEKQQVLLTHGDSIDNVSTQFRVIAKSGDLNTGIENRDKKLFAVQFHPEVDLTVNGKSILSNFLFKIANLKADYKIEDREIIAIEYIRKAIGQNKALLLLSGGVDSTVCGALLSKALRPEQIIAIHIDHGFMRQDESQQVIQALTQLGLRIKLVNAQDIFANATTMEAGQITSPLSQTTIPEYKRRIIGDTFVQVTSQVIQELNLDSDKTYLVQGTLRPDLIESASALINKNAQTIKTHHNDSQLVRELRTKGRVVEPLAEYHKDEVRQLGTKLGLSEDLVWRQPFPGPGLAVRIICAKTPYLDRYDQIFSSIQHYSSEEIKVTLLPIKSVGVQGDGRTYSYVVALSGSPNWPELQRLALEIPKTNHEVNRVVYVFGESINHPVKNITQTLLTTEVIDQLRQADAIVNKHLLENKLTRTITQVPVISIPIDFSDSGKRSIVIRTFITNDFMTGVPAMPGIEMPAEVLDQMVQQIVNQVPTISRVAYDLTSKPPGTTEWE